MPIYTYRCFSCLKTKEELVKTPGKQIYCGCGFAMEKVLSRPAKAIFKGKGFYQTDYKGK